MSASDVDIDSLHDAAIAFLDAIPLAVVDDYFGLACCDHSGAGAEEIAEAFHDCYERLAPRYGYTTRPLSAKPWAEIPDSNRALMVATVNELIRRGYFA